MMFLLPGCLLPFDTEVEVPVCVPSVESSPTTTGPPLNRITRIVRDPEALELDFEVDVRDCNEQQTLDYRVALNLDANNPSIMQVVDFGDIPPSQRTPFLFTLDLGMFVLNACNKVQLFVSGEFTNNDPRDPFKTTSPGDLATASWFIELVETATDEADFSRCR